MGQAFFDLDQAVDIDPFSPAVAMSDNVQTRMVSLAHRVSMNNFAMDLFEGWRAADRAATVAELALSSTLMRYYRNQGTPPDAQLIEEAKHKRELANVALEAALSEMDRRLHA